MSASKVVALLKKKGETLAQRPLELREQLSPVLLNQWNGLLERASNSQLIRWAREHHLLAEPEPANQPVVLHPDAQALLDELSAKIGEEIHVGPWMDITQERINQFAEVTEDRQWIHTDPERAAAESPFKTTTAHGFLTVSLLPVLTESIDPDTPQYPTAKMAVNYGLNQVRFPYPVRVGCRVRAHSRLLSVLPINRGLQLTKEVTIKIDGTRRPACIAETVLRLYF